MRQVRVRFVVLAVLVVGALAPAGAGRVAAGFSSSPPIVTGADAGGAPLVKGFGVDGAVQLSFFAYDAQFTGGVRVAVGDVNGDGLADIITGAGPGAGPHVKVFSAKDGSVLSSFFAYGALFTGGVYVAAGDVNGDGFADIITGAGAGGSPNVKVFSGKDGSVLSSFFAYDPLFTGGVRVAAGDVNGDGLADIITGAGPGAGPHVKAFSGKDGSELSSFFAYDPQFTGGVYVAAGDLDGDGRADIVTGAGAGAGPHVKAFSGKDGSELSSFFAFDPRFSGGVRVAVGDVNGDGAADIVTGAGPGSSPEVKAFDGRKLGVLSDFFAYDASFSGGVYVGSPATPARVLLVNVLLRDATGVGPGTSLLDKATQIQADLASGDTADACGTLNALNNQIRAQTGKSLSTAQVTLLTADAVNLKAAIPC